MRDEARTREERDRDQHKVQEEPGRQTERRGCLHSKQRTSLLGCSIGLGAELELGHGGLFACGKAWAARGIA